MDHVDGKHFEVQRVLAVVDGGFKEPAAGVVQTNTQQTDLEAHKLNDLKAKNYIFQFTDLSILETILRKDTSKKFGTP